MFLLYSLVDAVSSLLVLDSSTLLLLLGVRCMVYGGQTSSSDARHFSGVMSTDWVMHIIQVCQ
jgi:hypothetical protein